MSENLKKRDDKENKHIEDPSSEELEGGEYTIPNSEVSQCSGDFLETDGLSSSDSPESEDLNPENNGTPVDPDSAEQLKGSVEKNKLNKYLTIIFINILILSSVFFWLDKSYRHYFVSKPPPIENPEDDPNKISLILQDGASYIDKYYKLPDSGTYPRHMPVLTISGTWYEMGKQYGRGCGGFIRDVYDGFYEKWKMKPYGSYHLKNCLHKFDARIKAFSPDMTDFLKGIADGSSDALAQSSHKMELTNYEKILFINLSYEMLYNDSWHEKISGKKDISDKLNGNILPGYRQGTCWAALPRCTSGGMLITGVNNDSDYYPSLYQVALRVYPSDKSYNSFLMITTAGFAGSCNNINEKGLFVGWTGVGTIYRTEEGIREMDFGVPPSILSTYLISRCNRVVEVKKIIAEGNESFRRNTNRKTLLHSCGANYLVASRERALVVERSPHHFAYRYPGNRKEFNNSYIAATNHFMCPTSFNEEGIESYTPMTRFGWNPETKEASGSVARFNSVLHQLKVYYRQMNVNLGMNDICSLTSYFDGDDIEYTVVKVNGDEIPAREMGWTIDNQFKVNNIPIAGTISSFVNLPESGETFFVQGSPSDWFGDWDTIYMDRESGPAVLPALE